MAADDMHRIRTIGLLAEGGAGKTTLGGSTLVRRRRDDPSGEGRG